MVCCVVLVEVGIDVVWFGLRFGVDAGGAAAGVFSTSRMIVAHPETDRARTILYHSYPHHDALDHLAIHLRIRTNSSAYAPAPHLEEKNPKLGSSSPDDLASPLFEAHTHTGQAEVSR